MPDDKKRRYSKFDNSKEFRELGQAISYYRKYRGLSQDQLAERIGISRNHLSAIEAPNVFRRISMDAVFSIAKVLEIDAYLLLKFSTLRPEEESRSPEAHPR